MRGIRFVICLVLGLSVALAGCESLTTATHEPTVDPGIFLALAPACTGHAIAGAGPVNTAGTTANHLVLLGPGGQPSDLSGFLPDAWSPGSLADAELVGCVQEPQRTVLEVCPYIGSDITRYQVTRAFTVYAALTGQSLAAFDITATPRNCGYTESATLTELEGVIAEETVVAHLSGLVQSGRFVDPGEAGPTGQPGKTSEPNPSPQSAELRQALANGMVTISGTGDGLQNLDIELTSKVDFDVDVTIETGTLLEPAARGTQRMVVTQNRTVPVLARATASATLDVACVEMHQDQPTSNDSFRVLTDRPSADLERLLRLASFSDSSARVQQFAVWTITNNPKRNGYVGLRSGFDVFGSGPDDDEIGLIRDLFHAAGIDTGDYRALK